MNSERWRQIDQLLEAALEREPEERAAFLAVACAGDESLLLEVESLLRSDEAAERFIEEPVVALVAAVMSEQPAQAMAGQQIGHYRVISLLGRGGMGEVYLAQDTRLDRKVALKLLPARFTQDADRLRRFVQEAKSASALNHPGILTIHEIGQEDGNHFIVTEFVNGQTLRQLMNDAQMNLAEALDIAIAVAGALRPAHEAGIIHRDIKPENVMARADGLVKVLDFGLAKLTEGQMDGETDGRRDGETERAFNYRPSVSQSFRPSVALSLTEAGMVMGTPQYMSPEQTGGRKVDQRSDIFSLGVTLYEMVAGRKPFEGETVGDVIAAILKTEPPPVTEARPDAPSELQRILSKALAKDRDERYQAIKDLELDLRSLKKELEFQAGQAASEETSRGHRLTVDASRGRAVRLVVTSLLIAVVAAPLLAWLFYRYRPSRDNFESEILPQLKTTLVDSWKTEPGQSNAVLSSSPDGKLLAFAKTQNGQADIYVKQISGGETRNLTNDAWTDFSPMWSPDGRRIAYISLRDGKAQVRLIHLGGDGQSLCALNVVPRWLTDWTRDGAGVYYEADHNLYALDLASCESRRLTDFPADSTKSDFAVSADKQWLAWQESVGDAMHLFVAPMAGGAPVQVTREGESNTTPLWLPDGERLIYSSLRNGVRQICVVSRDGSKSIQITFGHETMTPWNVTPDGRNIFYFSDRDESDLYLLDARTGAERRFSAEILVELFPAFAPDGRSVAFQQWRQGELIYRSSLFIKSIEGGDAVRLSESGFDPRWSPDGARLAFLREVEEDYQLWTARKDGSQARPVVKEKVSFLGYAPRPYGWTSPPNFSWSPDGRRLIYGSRRTGQSNLYSIALEGNDETQLTGNTDSQLRLFSPIWAPDGKQFAYIGRRLAEGARPRTIYLYDGAQHRSLWQTTDEEIKLLGWSATSDAVYIAAIKGPRDIDPTEVKLLRLSTSQSNAGAPAKVVTRFADAYLQNVALAPGAEKVAYVVRQDDADNIWIASLTTGRRRRLTTNADPNLSLGCLAWAPQANLLGFAKQSNATSIWMIENFK